MPADRHQPRQLDRALCEQASALFVMAARYLRWLLVQYGSDLASQAYLFADPFTPPQSLERGQYTVCDPSFDQRPVQNWCANIRGCERVLQISQARSQ